MEIKREKYLTEIIERKNNNLIIGLCRRHYLKREIVCETNAKRCEIHAKSC